MTDGSPVHVRIRAVRHHKVETFERDLTGDLDKALVQAIDYYEDHVGPVLSVDDMNGNRLFKSMLSPWEAGVR